jgi:hypothetical protein
MAAWPRGRDGVGLRQADSIPPRPEPSKTGRRALLAAAFALSALAAAPAAAVQLQPAHLGKLIGSSDLIVAGTVKSVTDGLDGGLPYTEVTISVASSAKKKLAPRSDFKFRQYGLLAPRKLADGSSFLGTAPEGFPHWAQGEQVLAFLYKPASRTGLRTTVGLAQGKFTTLGGRSANEFGNRGLFANLQVSPGLLTPEEAAMVRKPAGDVDATALLRLVNRAVAGQWVERGMMK